MPKTRSRLTTTECEEYRRRLMMLGEMGIITGNAGGLVLNPHRFTLEQSWHDLAGVYDLPSGEVAVVAYARLTVSKSGVMTPDFSMFLPWDNFPLDLDDPEETPYFNELLGGSPYWPPKLLNRLLTGQSPLSPSRHEGAIVAKGWTTIPSICDDGTLTSVSLLVEDEPHNSLRFKFRARVDRNLKRRYDRQSQQRRTAFRLSERVGPYGSKETEIPGQARRTQEQGRGSVSDSVVAVSPIKPMEGSTPLDIPRAGTEEPTAGVKGV